MPCQGMGTVVKSGQNLENAISCIRTRSTFDAKMKYINVRFIVPRLPLRAQCGINAEARFFQRKRRHRNVTPWVGWPYRSSSGIPAREVSRDATAASAAVPTTTFQSTSVIIAEAGSRATVVWAKVFAARIAAALPHLIQLRI